MKLEDRVAIITGAGRGIGKAIALKFAEEGASLTAVSRTAKEVNETVSEIRAVGKQAIACVVDISIEPEVQRMTDQTVEEFGRIDILVNNAGVLGPIGPLVGNDINEWMYAIQVNLIGTFHCSRAVLPYMVRQRSGKIVNVCGAGGGPSPRFSAYACSKAAIVRLTETLAQEVEDFNIQVNGIAPGPVNTRMQDEILLAGECAGDGALATAMKTKKEGRSPQYVAELAAFLASDDSDGLTGRLVSAAWDDWKNWDKPRIESLMLTQLYTLRRIDNVYFYEGPSKTS